MRRLELQLTFGNYRAALSFDKRPQAEIPPEALPVVLPIDTKIEQQAGIQEMTRWSKSNLIIILGSGLFILFSLFITVTYVFPLNLLAAVYIFAVAVIVGLQHIVPRTPRDSTVWSDFALIMHPQIFPWSSVTFAVMGALAALSASNEHFSSDLRGFLNALAYLIPVIGLMVDANKSFAEAAHRVLGGEKLHKRGDDVANVLSRR